MTGPAADAFDRALGALARKERTRAELEDWLAERGFDPDEITAAIEQLAEAGKVDDARFAHRYAADKRELRGWGADRIRNALAARGIPDDLIAAAVDGESRAAELDRAIGLLARRGEPLDDDASRGRALAYLVRRGYDSEVAYSAIRRAGLLSETGGSTIPERTRAA